MGPEGREGGGSRTRTEETAPPWGLVILEIAPVMTVTDLCAFCSWCCSNERIAVGLPDSPRNTTSCGHRVATTRGQLGQARRCRVIPRACDTPPARALHIPGRQHPPPTCATAGFGGGQQSGRRWDQITANCTGADRGSTRPGKALTQPNPIPPPPPSKRTRPTPNSLCGGCHGKKIGVRVLLESWITPLLKCIPKFATAEKLKDMHPLALQNIRMKGISTVITLRMNDALQELTPQEQKGFCRVDRYSTM